MAKVKLLKKGHRVMNQNLIILIKIMKKLAASSIIAYCMIICPQANAQTNELGVGKESKVITCIQADRCPQLRLGVKTSA